MTRPLTAVDSSAFIREQSERAIRANAHRLVAGRHDALAQMPAGQRRAELLTLAEKVAVGELHADALAAAALPHLTSVEDIDGLFDELVVAVTERHRFVADPDEWLVRHDFLLSSACFDAQDEATMATVDEALDYLAGNKS